MASQRQIIFRHRESLNGRLRYRVFHSNALEIRKPFYVYEPPGLQTLMGIPTLYLFRGHEREWVNIDEDESRERTAIEDIDLLIDRGHLPPMVVVMPGLNSKNNHVPSLGINMVGPSQYRPPGMGTGKYWDFLHGELFPRIETDYRQTRGGARMAAGFSLGGYTVSLIAMRLPGFLHHAGVYDGLFMFPRHIDRRQPKPKPFCDPIWNGASLFDAAFGRPRNRAAMNLWNPTDLLAKREITKETVQGSTAFWITAAPTDGMAGNRDRAAYFVSLLKARGHRVGFESTVFHPEAEHTWHWADRFLVDFLTSALS